VNLNEVKVKENKENVLDLKESKKGFKRIIKRAVLILIIEKLK
jgi:hypothetical protein